MAKVVRSVQGDYELHLDEADRTELTDIYLPNEKDQKSFLRVKSTFPTLTGRIVDQDGRDVGDDFVIRVSTNLRPRLHPSRPNQQYENHGEYQAHPGGIDVTRTSGVLSFDLSLGGVLDRMNYELQPIKEVLDGQPTVRVYRRLAA